MTLKYTQEEIIARREARKQKRKDEKELAEIDEMRNQKPVNRITITIEWKKSRTWGSNPIAEATIGYKDGSFGRVGPFTCSGCGYDKESTVIARIFNTTLRYKLFTRLGVDSPYGMYYYNGVSKYESYKNHDGKTISYYHNPGYNGGVGTSCYYKIAEFIGGKFVHVASGNMFDVYEYTDGRI